MRYGRKHTGALNVEEINIMSGGVDHGPESHGVRDLSVEPDVLVGGEKPGHAGADNTDDVSQHGNENKASIEGKNEPSSSRRPDRPCQPVQGGQLLVGCLEKGMSQTLHEGRKAGTTNLAVPTISEEEKVEAIEDDVKRKAFRLEEFALEPVFAHRAAGLLSQRVRIPNERRPAGQTKE